MRCAIYARVSTDMLSQKDSLENQQTFFKNYIMVKGWEMHDIYADEGITGTSTAKRRELKRLMEDAEKCKFDIVLVKSLSRWARDTVDSITLVRKLKSYGIVLKTIDDNYNSFDDENEMKLTMYSMFAQQESEAASKRVSFGIAEKSRKGVFHGAPPYGYDKIDGKLVPNELYAPIVQNIFKLYLYKNWGCGKIANYLTDQGIATPRQILGAKNAGIIWYESAVRIILKNPHYVGDLVQGRSKVNKTDKIFHQEKGYKKRIQIDENDWIYYRNAHQPIISRAEFEAVQEKITFKYRKHYRGRGNKSLFARLAYCADCGKGMNYKNEREGYVCATYQKNGNKKCPSHFIKHRKLKDTIIGDLRNLSSNILDTTSLVDSMLKKVGLKATKAKVELERIRKAMEQLKQDRLELVRILTQKLIDDETFKISNGALGEKLERLANQEKELETIVVQEQESKGIMKKFQEEVKKYAELDIEDEEVLREVFQRLIDRIEIAEDGSIKVFYNFKNPLLMGV